MDQLPIITPIKWPESNNDIFLMREDLIPFSFGGNKARIAMEFVSDMKAKGCDCMIGTGTTSSNLCRALASACAQAGCPCHLVLFDSPPGDWHETFNLTLMEKSGAIIHKCRKDDTASVVSDIMAEASARGEKPYFMNGSPDGFGNEVTPLRAYAEIFRTIGDDYDYVFLPVGACMTVSGLIAGKARYGGKPKIVGISISRAEDRAVSFIRRYVDAYTAEYSLPPVPDSDICFTDKYLCGGYGLCTPEIVSVIDEMWRLNAVPLDRTYTGKGFTGMLNYLKDNRISGSKVLYIHTGGTPLFFDGIR